MESAPNVPKMALSNTLRLFARLCVLCSARRDFFIFSSMLMCCITRARVGEGGRGWVSVGGGGRGWARVDESGRGWAMVGEWVCACMGRSWVAAARSVVLGGG